MADGGGDGDPLGVEVPGVGGDGISPPEGGSSVDDRHTSAGTTDAGARGRRTLFQPLPPGLDSTGTRHPSGAPSGRTHPEAVPSGAGTHFGGGQLPDVTTWGGGSVPPAARESAGGSSSRAPRGSRSAKGAPEREHGAGHHCIGPPALGPGGRSPLRAREEGAVPDSAREPAGGSSSRASPGSRGAREGQGLEWRDAVAEVVRSEVTRSLVTMLRGSTPRPAERRGRARRSSRRRRRGDSSSSSSTTDVSRSGDESTVAALLGAFRATPTPLTVRDGTRGIDPRTQPTPGSEPGERGGWGSRELPRGMDPGFPTHLPLATGMEAEGWPTQRTPPPPTRVVPPNIVVNHPYYRMMFDCETYALDNKSVAYTRRQARTLGRRKKDVAQSFGVRDEWDGSPPAKVFQFLRKFSKACDDNDISEGEAFSILQDCTKEPLKSEVMMVVPTRREGNPGEVTSYLELINWMLRRHVDEASVATLVETLNVAVQRDDEDELSFAERLRRLNTECGFMYGEGAHKGRFVEGVHRAARATARERNTPGMTMAELARVAQTKGDEYRWLRLEQLKERTKEREVLAEETRLRRQARAAALPRVTGGARGCPPREAPVRVVGAVDAPTLGARRDAARPGAPDGSTPGGGDNSRRRFRQRDESSRPKPRAGEYPGWQCGQVGHWAEVCPTLDARLRDRLAMASRWSPLWAPSGSRDTQRMGRRVAVAIPNEDSSSSGDQSTPLEKGEPQAEPEGGPATSSESEEGNE